MTSVVLKVDIYNFLHTNHERLVRDLFDDNQ